MAGPRGCRIGLPDLLGDVVQPDVLALVVVVIAASRAVGWAISKIGQPQVHGEILAGIILGPSLLGWAWPQAVAYLFPKEGSPS